MLSAAPIDGPSSLNILARAALLAVVAIAVAAPLPTRAHADLVEATPAPNGTLVQAPSVLELTFSEPIDPDLAFVDLLDAAQEPVDGLGPVDVSADGREARVALPDLEPGVYTVSYQVVSRVDGHATAGAYAFVIDPTGSEAPPATPPAASTPAVDGWAVAARWVGLAGGLVALGSLVLWWRSRRLLPAGAAGPPWALIGVAAGLAYAGLAAYLWLSARPIVEAVPDRGTGLPLDFAAPFGATPFAVAMRVALAGSALTAVVAIWGRLGARRDGLRAPAFLAAFLAAAALAGNSMAAHAAAAGGVAFGLVDWAHLLAVAAWLGGLPAVLVLSRRPGGPTGTAWAILRHHGPLALAAAPLVVLTGVANSPLVLGSARGLVGSEYGNLLLAKGLLVAVALALGAVNHLALRGRGRARVMTILGVELAVALLAVGVAATMVTIQPAAAREPTIVSPPVAPAHLFGEAGSASVHATIDLPTPGSQRYLVTVNDAESGVPRDDVQLVFLELTPPPTSGLPMERVDLSPAAERPGLYTAEGALLSVEGDWAVEVVVRRSGALDERVRFIVPVQAPAPPQRVPPADTGIGVPGPLAAVWTLLPDGAAAWLPAILALAALAALGAWQAQSGSARSIGVRALRVTLGAVTVVAVLGAGSRLLVDAANAPTARELEQHEPDQAFAASVDTGEAVYRANCAACHGLDGDGRGPVRTLPPAGSLPDAVDRMSPAELSYRIANGLAGTPMPAFAATLTEAERWHLVTYLEERWSQP